MKTRIIKIGNSQGIRIPKSILLQTGLKDEIELLVEDNSLVIRSHAKPRSGWNQAFAAMRTCRDDQVLGSMGELVNDFDEKEWEWK
jgi:antitoxin MazE